MSRDSTALTGSTDHSVRTVHGVAVGDLDEDGYEDIVSVSSEDLPAGGPRAPAPELGGEFQNLLGAT